MMDFWQVVSNNFSQSTWIEGIAVIFGLASVWYAAKNNILVYPTGIVSVLLYVYICQKAGLYADMGINAFYFGMSVFGWYSWTHQSGKSKERTISRTNLLQKIILIVMFFAFFFILKYTLIHYTDSTVPFLDSLNTAIFLIAMWLMALKKIENWILWILGDLISLPLYIQKGLYLTTFQYFVFLILAVKGYVEWRKIISRA